MQKLKSSDSQVGMITVSPIHHREFLSSPLDSNQGRTYSTRKLFTYGYVLPGGSILTWQLMIRSLAMCAAATFFALYPCKNIPALGWSFCFPILNSSEGLIFAGLVSFLLGLFQSTTFSRWWSTREKLCTLMNNVKYSAILLGSCVTGDAGTLALRDKVVRWLNLSHALVYKHGNKDYDLRDLVQQGVATEEESEILTNVPNLPGAPFDWAVNGLHELAVRNAITPAAIFAPLLTSMSAVFTAGQEVAMFIETQLPYSYIHLLTLITKIHLVFVVFYGAGILSAGVTGESWTRIIFGYATIITNNVIYEGLLAIHDMLVNPLGTDQGDFPTGVYRQTTEAFTKHVLGGPSPSVTIL